MNNTKIITADIQMEKIAKMEQLEIMIIFARLWGNMENDIFPNTSLLMAEELRKFDSLECLDILREMSRQFVEIKTGTPDIFFEQHILRYVLKEYDSFMLLLSDGNYLAVWASDNEAFSDNCDSVVGFTLYGPDKKEIDGGELDFNSETQYQNGLIDAVEDILDDVYFNKEKPAWYRLSIFSCFDDEFE